MSTIGRVAAKHQATDAIGQSLLGLAGSLAWSRLSPLILLFTLPLFLPSIAPFLLSTSSQSPSIVLLSIVLPALFFPVVSAPILSGAFVTVLTRHRAGDPAPLLRLVPIAAKDFLRALPIGLALGLANSLAFSLLVVPGFFVQVFFFLAPAVFVFEKTSVRKAFTRSAELTKGIRLNIFASFVLLSVISGTVSYFLTPVVGLLLETILKACFAVAVYQSRRQQLEDLYLADLGKEAGFVPDESILSDAQLDDAIENIRKSAARTRKLVAFTFTAIVVTIVSFIGKNYYEEKKKERDFEARVQSDIAKYHQAQTNRPAPSATTTAPRAATDEFAEMTNDAILEKLETEPQNSRKATLGKILASRGKDLYGPGLSNVFRQLHKAGPEQRNLAILPALSQDLAKLHCNEALSEARNQPELSQGRYFFSKCKPAKLSFAIPKQHAIPLYSQVA